MYNGGKEKNRTRVVLDGGCPGGCLQAKSREIRKGKKDCLFWAMPRRRLRELGVLLAVAGFALLQWLHTPFHAPAEVAASVEVTISARWDLRTSATAIPTVQIFSSGPPGIRMMPRVRTAGCRPRKHVLAYTLRPAHPAVPQVPVVSDGWRVEVGGEGIEQSDNLSAKLVVRALFAATIHAFPRARSGTAPRLPLPVVVCLR